MAPNFRGPYWVQNNYHGALGIHTQSLCTKNWNPGSGSGTFDTWSGTPIAAATMIAALVTLELPFFNSDIHFDNWIIYKQLLPADDPQPVMSGAFSGMTGTNTGGSWAGAVEYMLIARTSGFNIAKLVMLDACSEDNFNPITVFTGALAGLYGEWGADVNGWCGRDNNQVTIPLKATININQKLRKEYRLD